MAITRPKTVYGSVLLILVALAVIPLLVSLVTAVGPWAWPAFAAIGVMAIAMVLWRRHVEAGRERAWGAEFSFGEVVERMRARNDATIAAEAQARSG
jgi:hypothetical protein